MSGAARSAGAARGFAANLAEVRLEAEGRMTGNVLVSRQDGVLLVKIMVAHGHLPAATRRRLVEQAFRLPELSPSRQRVLVTIPLGDVELLQGLRARLCEVRVRAAGATCLVEATTL